MIKLTYLLKRRSDVEPTEFAARWQDSHAAVLAENADVLGALRYVLSLREATACDICLNHSRGLAEPSYDGVLEIWWASTEAYQAGMGSAQGLRLLNHLIDAERRLIDFARSQAFFTRKALGIQFSKDLLSDQTSINPLIDGIDDLYSDTLSTPAV